MVFIPLSDSNPRRWIASPFATIAIVAACTVIFIAQSQGDTEARHRLILGLGVIPAILTGRAELGPDLAIVPSALTLVTAQFLHGGWFHLAGNMLFLWVFGDNVEDAMGHRRFLVFYVLCGMIAAIAQIAAAPDSTLPMVGASGAVAGVLGAYLVLYPRVRILVLVLGPFPLRLPSWFVLGVWVALQAMFASSSDPQMAGVAWWAHLSGFAAGAILIRYFRFPHVPLFNTARDGSLRVAGVRLRSKNDRDTRP